MKLSELNSDQIASLSAEQLATLIYGGIRDGGECADAALLLGSRPEWCHERAVTAAELYRAGRVRYIMPTGGVEWDWQGVPVSEAYYMRKVLLEQGVPDDAILLENEARTTKENMICGALELNRRLKLQNVRRVAIVTTAYHMRRSLALADWLLPRSIACFGVPSLLPDDPVRAIRDSDSLRRSAIREVTLIKGLTDSGMIEDPDYPI